MFCIATKRFVSLIIIACAFLFGIGWYFVGLSTFQGKTYENSVIVSGRVSDDLKVYENYGKHTAYVTLKNVEIDGQKDKNIDLKINLEDKTDIKIGDLIVFESKVENVKFFEFGNFNSGNYRAGAPYKAEVEALNLEIIGNELSFDEKIRLSVKEQLYKNMGQEYGAVGYAVLFGNKDDVESEMKESFKMAGVIHILTVSGLHVSFLIALIGFVLKKCRIRGWLNFLICSIFLGLYAYMCGFAPSVLRAGIMGLVLLTTKISGKCYDSLNSLGLAGVIILLIFPLSALDLGFLMSFFCVLGIFIVSPMLNKLFGKFLPKTVAGSFAISISASIGILPFMASFYGTLNLLSVFANLIIIPIFSVLYPILFIFALLTTVLPWLGFMLTACKFGLLAVHKISEFFASTSLSVGLVPISIFVVTAVFLSLFLASKYTMLGKRCKIICSSSLLLFSLLFSLFNIFQAPSVGVAYSFNYSYDCIMITNSQNKTAIIDLNGDVQSLMSLCNVKQISSVFLLDYYVKDINLMREIGVKNIFSCKSSKNYDEEVLVNENTAYEADGFKFVFKVFDEQLCALEIAFDDVKVLVLSDDITEQVCANYFVGMDYDFVMLGERIELGKYFSAGTVVQGYGKDVNVDKNYLQDGNSFYKIKESGFVWRCLD